MEVAQVRSVGVTFLSGAGDCEFEPVCPQDLVGARSRRRSSGRRRSRRSKRRSSSDSKRSSRRAKKSSRRSPTKKKNSSGAKPSRATRDSNRASSRKQRDAGRKQDRRGRDKSRKQRRSDAKSSRKEKRTARDSRLRSEGRGGEVKGRRKADKRKDTDRRHRQRGRDSDRASARRAKDSSRRSERKTRDTQRSDIRRRKDSGEISKQDAKSLKSDSSNASRARKQDVRTRQQTRNDSSRRDRRRSKDSSSKSRRELSTEKRKRRRRRDQEDGGGDDNDGGGGGGGGDSGGGSEGFSGGGDSGGGGGGGGGGDSGGGGDGGGFGLDEFEPIRGPPTTVVDLRRQNGIEELEAQRRFDADRRGVRASVLPLEGETVIAQHGPPTPALFGAGVRQRLPASAQQPVFVVDPFRRPALSNSERIRMMDARRIYSAPSGFPGPVDGASQSLVDFDDDLVATSGGKGFIEYRPPPFSPDDLSALQDMDEESRAALVRARMQERGWTTENADVFSDFSVAQLLDFTELREKVYAARSRDEFDLARAQLRDWNQRNGLVDTSGSHVVPRGRGLRHAAKDQALQGAPMTKGRESLDADSYTSALGRATAPLPPVSSGEETLESLWESYAETAVLFLETTAMDKMPHGDDRPLAYAHAADLMRMLYKIWHALRHRVLLDSIGMHAAVTVYNFFSQLYVYTAHWSGAIVSRSLNLEEQQRTREDIFRRAANSASKELVSLGMGAVEWKVLVGCMNRIYASPTQTAKDECVATGRALGLAFTLETVAAVGTNIFTAATGTTLVAGSKSFEFAFKELAGHLANYRDEVRVTRPVSIVYTLYEQWRVISIALAEIRSAARIKAYSSNTGKRFAKHVDETVRALCFSFHKAVRTTTPATQVPYKTARDHSIEARKILYAIKDADATANAWTEFFEVVKHEFTLGDDEDSSELGAKFGRLLDTHWKGVFRSTSEAVSGGVRKLFGIGAPFDPEVIAHLKDKMKRKHAEFSRVMDLWMHAFEITDDKKRAVILAKMAKDKATAEREWKDAGIAYRRAIRKSEQLAPAPAPALTPSSVKLFSFPGHTRYSKEAIAALSLWKAQNQGGRYVTVWRPTTGARYILTVIYRTKFSSIADAVAYITGQKSLNAAIQAKLVSPATEITVVAESSESLGARTSITVAVDSNGEKTHTLKISANGDDAPGELVCTIVRPARQQGLAVLDVKIPTTRVHARTAVFEKIAAYNLNALLYAYQLRFGDDPMFKTPASVDLYAKLKVAGVDMADSIQYWKASSNDFWTLHSSENVYVRLIWDVPMIPRHSTITILTRLQNDRLAFGITLPIESPALEYIGASVNSETRGLIEMANADDGKLRGHLLQLKVVQLLQIPDSYPDSEAQRLVETQHFWQHYMREADMIASATVEDGSLTRVVVSAKAGHLPQRQPNANAFTKMALSTKRNLYEECLSSSTHLVHAFWTQCGPPSDVQRGVFTAWARTPHDFTTHSSATLAYQRLMVEWVLDSLSLVAEDDTRSWRIEAAQDLLVGSLANSSSSYYEATLYDFGFLPESGVSAALWWRMALARVTLHLGLKDDDTATQQALFSVAWTSGKLEAPTALRLLTPAEYATYSPEIAKDEEFRMRFFANLVSASVHHVGDKAAYTRVLVKEAVMQWPRFWRNYVHLVEDAVQKFVRLWNDASLRLIVETTLRSHLEHTSLATEQKNLEHRTAAVVAAKKGSFCKDAACVIQQKYTMGRRRRSLGSIWKA